MLINENNQLPVVSIQRHRINSDGNGIRTLVHSYNCNLNCKWCCNPETRYGESFTNFTIEELFKKVRIDDLYFLATKGGITFSGGEPLLYYKFINEFSKKCKEMNWTVAIESAFNVNKDVIDSIIPNIDEFLIDIKCIDNNIHNKHTGTSNIKILENITYLSQNVDASKIRISIPIIPNINDSEENLIKTIEFMKQNNLNNLHLLPYRDYSQTKYKDLGLNYEINEIYNENQYNKLLEIVKNSF